MAEYTPVHEIHLSAGTLMNNDDSGYLTPNSVDSLDSGQWSNTKPSGGCTCSYRNHASSTPDAVLLHTPGVCCHRAHPSLCHKRKTSLGRFKLLQRPVSSLSTLNGVKKSPFIDAELSLQSKGELLLDHDLDELSLVDNSFDSQESCKFDDSAMSYDEVDENESVWKADSKGDNTEQMDTNEKAKYHLAHMSTPHEVCRHDNGTDNKERVNPFDSQKGDLPTEGSDLITDKLTNLTRRDISQDPPKICQTFDDYTHSIPFSLKRSSRQHPCSVGREKVDFLSLFGEKSDHSIIVKAILSYLEPVDLTAVAVVSKTWNRVCMADSDACRRMHCYMEHKQKNKENEALFPVNKLDSAAAHIHPRIYLRQIQNVGNEGGSHIAHNPHSPPPSPSKRRFLQFYKAAQKLENGKMLAPCPRCSLPSQIDVVSNVGQCTHERCQYLFCCICHCESHNGNTCPFSVSFPRSRKRFNSVGSKASKKNLRRL